MNKKQKASLMPDMKPDVSFVNGQGRKSLEKAGSVKSMSYFDEPNLEEDMGSVKTIRKS